MIFRKTICFLFFASINCLFDTLQFSLIPETASHLFEKQNFFCFQYSRTNLLVDEILSLLISINYHAHIHTHIHIYLKQISRSVLLCYELTRENYGLMRQLNN